MQKLDLGACYISLDFFSWALGQCREKENSCSKASQRTVVALVLWVSEGRSSLNHFSTFLVDAGYRRTFFDFTSFIGRHLWFLVVSHFLLHLFTFPSWKDIFRIDGLDMFAFRRPITKQICWCDWSPGREENLPILRPERSTSWRLRRSWPFGAFNSWLSNAFAFCKLHLPKGITNKSISTPNHCSRLSLELFFETMLRV